jgi:hypothetical protein
MDNFNELAKRWPYIIKWEDLMGGGREYLRRQLAKAEETNAPATALHYTEGKGWSTLENLRNEDIRCSWGLEPLVPEGTIEAIIERLEREYGKPVAGDAYWLQQLRWYVNKGYSGPKSFYWFQREQYANEAEAAEIVG